MSSVFAGLKTYTSDDDGLARPARGTRGAATGKEAISSKQVGANTRREGRPLRDASRIGDERARRERRLLRDSIKAGCRPPPRDDEEEEGAIPVYHRAWEASFGGVFGSFDDESKNETVPTHLNSLYLDIKLVSDLVSAHSDMRFRSVRDAIPG